MALDHGNLLASNQKLQLHLLRRNLSDVLEIFITCISQILHSGLKTSTDEIELRERFNLTLKQLKWRQVTIKNKCGGGPKSFQQE
ncbi:hypothetical protein JNUCC42_05985 [Brevibacterium sp. JNUCC-42]|nr:hypothetical protein JNUCC42_05985 [Brevibacterium sp. JNUCC-42]